ncbi:hypothetical protein NIES2107_38910 [Nostoc carneum NIES-2107]|nr:hypothetical protein NIES2107_38910 [Nostoc carneum NIES-2107]
MSERTVSDRKLISCPISGGKAVKFLPERLSSVTPSIAACSITCSSYSSVMSEIAELLAKYYQGFLNYGN